MKRLSEEEISKRLDVLIEELDTISKASKAISYIGGTINATTSNRCQMIADNLEDRAYAIMKEASELKKMHEENVQDFFRGIGLL